MKKKKLKSKRLEFTVAEIKRFNSLARKNGNKFKGYAEFIIIGIGNGDLQVINNLK